jgi:D-threonate/D-erythronate kinase
MAHLRLLADDLTGALDSAARFLPLIGPVAVTWQDRAIAGSVAIDSGTRDLPAEAVRTRIRRLAPRLDAGAPAFKKIDSLLRGHVALELAACMRRFDHCVLAPAFPFQGRITRNGRQLARTGDVWRDTGVDLPAELRALGVEARMRDAETDADLDGIVSDGRRLTGRVLWCGTGGLAGALAGHGGVACPVLPPPILALVGSDHPASRAQIAAVPAELRSAVIVCDLLAGTDRHTARERIGETFRALLGRVRRPGTLFVTGGATLRDLCDAIGVGRLEVDGELEPGVPTSLLCGGDWDGQRLVSKSGAFGDTGFLARLLGDAR